jgi:endoglucanase
MLKVSRSSLSVITSAIAAVVLVFASCPARSVPGAAQGITDAFDVALAWSKEHGRPINVGEFGACAKGDLESRVRWTKFMADSAVERSFSYDHWEFCAPEFGACDQKAGVWLQPLLDAVVPPKK